MADSSGGPAREQPAPAGVVGLHHVQVVVPAGTEERVRGYYGAVLGLPEIEQPPAIAARGGVWFAVGDQELHVGVEEPFRPALKAHPCLLVTDVDAAAGAVAAAGGEVRWDEQIPGVRRFHTDDPFGNRVEVRQAD